ncbi:MAG: tRNA (N6-isopentenyl adenosine(37)-C2)-methylthiotransferase MiaB, partial [Firmicutes bacterium]|nr:tRNA (N6-isopentenyl adenosine(37)-C2)-methylthiotransferase MiaB [Bacillota bacterium]
SYFLITFGCQMNVHESEKLAGALRSLGFIPTKKKEEADIIVLNTCCVRQGAENRALGNIGAFKTLKKTNKDLIVCVGGCMTQQKTAFKKLQETYSFIDIIFGNQNLDKFKEMLLERIETKKKIREIEEGSPTPVESEISRADGDTAYININYGCDNFCTYCIVPYVRGRERSRAKQDIINEFKKVIAEENCGTPRFKTITLLGQNVNSYGKDLKPASTFVEIVSELIKVLREECWGRPLGDPQKIAFMTNHPKDFSLELVELMAKNEEYMAPEIHLPVQSGSSTVLKRMNRNYTREHYLNIINHIRKNLKKIYLTTDIIVGFPGETEEEYQETLSLIRVVKYDKIHAFMYSKRTGTPAANMEGQIDQKTKNRRVNEVLALYKDVLNKKM